MPDENKHLDIALFAGLIAINLIILNVLLGVRLPALRASAQLHQAKNAPQGQSQAFLPIVSRSGSVSIPTQASWYSENDGFEILHIVGEVVNNSSQPVAQVTIEAELFGSKNAAPLGKLSGSTYQTVIPPQGKACFNLYAPKPADFSSFKLNVTGYQSLADYPSGLRATVSNASFDAANQWYQVSGITSNIDGGLYPEISAAATLYDANGLVLGCDQTFVVLSGEDPNEPGTFTLYFLDRDYSQVQSSTVNLSIPLP